MPERPGRPASASLPSLRYLAAWLPVAAYVVATKARLLDHGEYQVAARFLGRAQADFSLGERLAFYGGDLVMLGLLVPVLLLALLAWCGRAARLTMVVMVGLVLVLLTGANDLSRGNVGRFLSAGMLRDAAWWGVTTPAQIRDYVGLGAGLKMVVVLAGVVLAARWAYRRDPGPAVPRPRLGPVLALVAGLGLLPASAHVGTTPFHQPLLTRLLAALGPERGEIQQWPAGTQPLALFRERTATPVPRDTVLAGRAAGDDVVLFVLETAAHRALAAEGDLTDMPTLARLRAQSLVATQHYSTYPFSSDAIFSILSGWYPLPRTAVVAEGGPATFPGLGSALRRAGYATYVYGSPRSTSPADAMMFDRLLGTRPAPLPGGRPTTIREDDAALLARMVSDLGQAIAANRRYLAVFLPQASHGPWPAAPGQDPATAAHAAIAAQDASLATLVALLERTGRLAHTLIVVTGDHGVRTRQEDPSLPVGKVDDYSFHVPFLLYAPAAFPATRLVQDPTSHLDIAPSLLHLLGVPPDPAGMQGTLLWADSLPQRRLFFFGQGYFGADGYRDPAGFAMASEVTGLTYHAASFSFPDSTALPPQAPADSVVRAHLAEMRALVGWWYRTAIAGD